MHDEHVMKYREIIKKLESLTDPKAIEGMARFGISAQSIYGVSMPDLRKLAREIGKDHLLAQRLWESQNRETRILASLVDIPAEVTLIQMDNWVKDFDSWEVCDQCCMNLFEKMPVAYEKAVEWSFHAEEFVKRAGFVLMARLAVSDKKSSDNKFEEFFSHIKRGAPDERNMVKKAVNWALRQIGKRTLSLNSLAVKVAENIKNMDSRSAKWIASDALRELNSEAVLRRLQKKL